jgi:hypothetical protein
MDERTRRALDRRASGAAGKHGDKRTKRNRSRSAQKQRAIREERS